MTTTGAQYYLHECLKNTPDQCVTQTQGTLHGLRDTGPWDVLQSAKALF